MLDTCLDQVQFIALMLDFHLIKDCIEAALVFESAVLKTGVRKEALRPLHYLFLSGEDMPCGEFKTMSGLGERMAADALGALFKRMLIKSNSPQGKVRFGLPQHALQFLFPWLWRIRWGECANEHVRIVSCSSYLFKYFFVTL